MMIRAEFLVDARPFSKIQGQPFKTSEIKAHLDSLRG
jgi:hypothetical protein